MKYFDEETKTVVQIKSNTNNYFEKLFIRLANEKDNNGYSIISYDDGELYTPDDLKYYLIATLTSNVQYDFGIDYMEDDVYDFAEALFSDHQKERAFKNLNKKVNKDTKLEIYLLAERVYSKDQTGLSKATCLDAIIELINEGKKIGNLKKMDDYKLLNKVHEVIYDFFSNY